MNKCFSGWAVTCSVEYWFVPPAYRTPWPLGKLMRRHWSTSEWSLMKPWGRAGKPKWTGWHTTSPKTTGSRAGAAPAQENRTAPAQHWQVPKDWAVVQCARPLTSFPEIRHCCMTEKLLACPQPHHPGCCSSLGTRERHEAIKLLQTVKVGRGTVPLRTPSASNTCFNGRVEAVETSLQCADVCISIFLKI